MSSAEPGVGQRGTDPGIGRGGESALPVGDGDDSALELLRVVVPIRGCGVRGRHSENVELASPVGPCRHARIWHDTNPDIVVRHDPPPFEDLYAEPGGAALRIGERQAERTVLPAPVAPDCSDIRGDQAHTDPIVRDEPAPCELLATRVLHVRARPGRCREPQGAELSPIVSPCGRIRICHSKDA